ncbi:MAG TPA: hypothetical protein PKD70_00570 [Saprospiraceae bacterium]|nr:hypothetical protein [Saprospiraceae bacterium]HMP12339.1 hypothetical protein [Saprospiraceae bacterium]
MFYELIFLRRKIWICGLLVLLLGTACVRDSRERLFELVYPDVRFEIPAGLVASLPWAFERRSMPTNIGFFLQQNKVDTAVISAISPVSARIISLDGANFGYEFVEQVSVLICAEGPQPCTLADEVFYIDDLRGRARERIDLLPTLRNARRNLIQERFKVEVIFFFRTSTPYSVSCRMDMQFEALR